MTAIRQSVPFVGSSILSTSIIISCFLGALSLGYYRGGKTSESEVRNVLTRNLVIGVFLTGIGLSYVFVDAFFSLASELSSGIRFLNNLLIHLFLYCLIVIVPLVFILGQTVPLLINSSNEKTTKSEAAGNATALSTVGSVLGCLLTPLVFMYLLGVGYSIFLNCMILSVCLLLLLRCFDRRDLIKMSLLTISLSISFTLNVRVDEQLFIKSTPYSNIHVVDEPNGRRMVVNRSSSSFISNKQEGWPYIEKIKKAILSGDMDNKKILALGAGGFSLTADMDDAPYVTYVDVDNALKGVAESRFLNQPIKGDFIVDDARSFLTNSDSRWDAIVVDLYSNSATIPQHTSTYEFFSLVNKRLNKLGKVAINVAANPYLNDRYSASIDLTIRESFSRCITDITDYRDTLVNIVYLCSRKNSDLNGVATIYKDDKTRVEVDSYLTSLNVRKWASER